MGLKAGKVSTWDIASMVGLSGEDRSMVSMEVVGRMAARRSVREFKVRWLLCVPITEPQQPPRSSESRADGYRQPLGLVQSGVDPRALAARTSLKGK